MSSFQSLLLASISTTVDPAGLHMPALTSAVAQLAGQTRGLALGLFLLAFVLALMLEAFATTGPTQPKDYAGVIWRGILVLTLLTFYFPIFRSLLSGAEALADQLAPPDAWSQLSADARKSFDTHLSAPLPAPAGSSDPGLLATAKELADRAGSAAATLGTAGADVLFSGLLMTAVLICQAIHWVMATLATILQGLLFILGPLALVASVPRASAIGTRWFTNLLTLAAWPIVSGLLAKITLAIGLKSFISTGAFGSLSAAVLMAALALATPVIASAIVGGGIRELVTPAVQTLGRLTTMAGRAAGIAGSLSASATALVSRPANPPKGTP